TNIFLAYNVWEAKYYGHRNERISDDSIREVVEILGQRGIQVNTPIPRDIYTDEILTARYTEIDAAELIKTVYQGKDVFPGAKGDSIRYSEDGIVLEIKNNREVFYNNLSLRNQPKGNLTEEQAVDIAENYLRENGLYKPTMTIDSVVPNGDGYLLSFLQKYKDKLLEVSVVEMEVTSGGVNSMHMLWLDPVKAERSRKKISHAVDALIKVAGQKEILKRVPVEIDSIRLVHYFDWKTAREGEAFPAWRICVDGEAYYVNALSGQISK
ncbi:MAG: two-component system regulatory protein YycI, partial [Bacillota bacterium]